MKRVAWALVVLSIAIGLAPSPQVGGGALRDLVKGFQKALGSGSGLSNSEIVAGLKEALQIGTKNAVAVLSRVNGYYNDTEIRIRLPASVRSAEKILRAAGYGSTVDRFERSMNRAAERAAPRAKALLWDAVEQMSFADARQILYGEEDAATRYFQDKTAARLQVLFKPVVAESMSEVGVTRTYRQLEGKLRSISFAQSVVFDLDQYVTEKAVDGLFVMLAREEAAIRKDPAARVTETLQKVFGDQTK
jgi:hypothetical protein